jgi:hypothetical protein
MYHGLARRYGLPPVLLMRPLLNGVTLDRQEFARLATLRIWGCSSRQRVALRRLVDELADWPGVRCAVAVELAAWLPVAPGADPNARWSTCLSPSPPGPARAANLVVGHMLVSREARPHSRPGAKAAAGELASSLPIARCASRACCPIATDHGLAAGRACLAGFAPPSARRTLLSNKPLQLTAAVVVT